jgi:hypothetical protein
MTLERMSDHRCDRKDPSAKVVDDPGGESITRLA